MNVHSASGSRASDLAAHSQCDGNMHRALHRARRLVHPLLFAVALAVGVVAGAFANRWPAWGTTRQTYCTLCAMHREEIERTPLLGRHRAESTRAGVLHELLAPGVGAHAHVYGPPAFVAPTSPTPKLDARAAFAQAVAEAELHDLEALEATPHAIALLDEAMRNDRARTVKFVQMLLDPTAFVPVEAIGLLDRKGSWEERWAVVDAFFGAYRCDVTELSASCRLRAGTTDLLVLVRTATTVHAGGIDWAHWTATAPSGTTPQTYAAVTLND